MIATLYSAWVIFVSQVCQKILLRKLLAPFLNQDLSFFNPFETYFKNKKANVLCIIITFWPSTALEFICIIDFK